MKTKKTKPKRKQRPSDVLDVTLEVTTRGEIVVEMTRKQYEQMADPPHFGKMALDDVPGVDWSGLTTTLNFHASLLDVFDGNE